MNARKKKGNMGIKKVSRPMNKAKNSFINWLKLNNADSIDGDVYAEHDAEWDYYVVISGFIKDSLFTAYFMVWNGVESIDYSDDENTYSRMTIEEFMNLIA